MESGIVTGCQICTKNHVQNSRPTDHKCTSSLLSYTQANYYNVADPVT